MDYTLAVIIVPLLKDLKRRKKGYPVVLTRELWNHFLLQMIWSFEEIKNNCPSEDEIHNQNDNDQELRNRLIAYNDRIQEGLDLFGTWYRDLWW